MREISSSGSLPALTSQMDVEHGNLTLMRGRNLFSTLRMLALQGIKQPIHSTRHILALGGQLSRVLLGATVHQPNDTDVRFQDPSWRLNPFYRRRLQTYLSLQKQFNAWVDESNLSDDDRTRVHFLLDIVADALAPSNSPLNPLALKELLNTGGTSVIKGIRHMVDDMLHNGGMPSQVNKQAFEVGRNLATTPGAVVFRNELLELIQYKPMSEQQYARPVLIVPPQINKFYIYDLTVEKSFVQYALKNRLQVFTISWRNPDARHRDWGMTDYVQAIEQAVDACRSITASKEVNLIGACAGGLSIAALQGYLLSKRQLRKIASATYLVTALDCQVESPAALFVDEPTLEAAKRRSDQHGVLNGRDMARMFAWLRPNDLIWNYWINNYLLGKEPPSFDVLFWNNDTTCLPAALHADFLDFFKINCLEVCGTPVDLKKINIDSFHVGGANDHITPWDTAYRSANALGGKKRFLLSRSGHIQAILNPPGNPKAEYMEHDTLYDDPQVWYGEAQKYKGSWWTTWLDWVHQRSGEQRETLDILGNQDYPVLDPAPGTYVFETGEA